MPRQTPKQVPRASRDLQYIAPLTIVLQNQLMVSVEDEAEPPLEFLPGAGPTHCHSEGLCETVSKVMPNDVACSNIVLSISRGTAEVHSSRMAYCRNQELLVRTLSSWPQSLGSYLGLVIEQPCHRDPLFIPSAKSISPLFCNVPSSFPLDDILHANDSQDIIKIVVRHTAPFHLSLRVRVYNLVSECSKAEVWALWDVREIFSWGLADRATCILPR